MILNFLFVFFCLSCLLVLVLSLLFVIAFGSSCPVPRGSFSQMRLICVVLFSYLSFCIFGVWSLLNFVQSQLFLFNRLGANLFASSDVSLVWWGESCVGFSCWSSLVWSKLALVTHGVFSRWVRYRVSFGVGMPCVSSALCGLISCCLVLVFFAALFVFGSCRILFRFRFLLGCLLFCVSLCFVA